MTENLNVQDHKVCDLRHHNNENHNIVKIDPIPRLFRSQSMINEEEEKRRTWDSCCLTCDKIAVKYFIQVSILISLIIASVIMTIINDECNSQRNWSNILTLCLGILCPSPIMK